MHIILMKSNRSPYRLQCNGTSNRSPVGYSIIVALIGLSKQYSVIVALISYLIQYKIIKYNST